MNRRNGYRRHVGCWLMAAWVLWFWCGGNDYLNHTWWYRVEYRELITRYAHINELPPELVAAVIYTESRFTPDAESPRGAVGLMQLMPDTAAWVAEQQGTQVHDLRDPEENIRLGTWYLRYLRTRFTSPEMALAAYNAGHGHVEDWLEAAQAANVSLSVEAIPFPETREFVKSVTGREEAYRIHWQ